MTMRQFFFVPPEKVGVGLMLMGQKYVPPKEIGLGLMSIGQKKFFPIKKYIFVLSKKLHYFCPPPKR